MTKKLFSKILMLALVVGVFGVLHNAYAASVTMNASNQTIVSGTTASINTITIVDVAGAEVTDASNLKIKIPAAVDAIWLISDTDAVIGGTAFAKVSTTVSYAESNKTLVLDVTADFTTGQTVTIGGLSIVATAPSAATLMTFAVDGSTFVAANSGTIAISSHNEGVGTQTNIGNVSPVLNTTPSDGGSNNLHTLDYKMDTKGYPTMPTSNVTFTGKALDVNSDQYYLAICKGNGIAVGNDDVPTCTGGEWAMSAATNSNSAITPITYIAQVTDPENNPWYAFVCDKLPTAKDPACYPANSAGDTGFAWGTVTFADVPADEDTVTVNSKVYKFDKAGDGCTGSPDQCVVVTTAEDASQAAAALADYATNHTPPADAVHMTARGAVTYVYADAAGASTITMSKSCANCTVTSPLADGDDDNASPFYVNHAPEMSGYDVGDELGDSIEPGEDVYVGVTITDSDTDGGQDSVQVFVCGAAGFTAGTNPGCNSLPLCDSGLVAPTSAGCHFGDMTQVPTSAGTKDIYVYAVDNHGYEASGGGQQQFEVTNVPPVLTGYTTADTLSYTAGGSDIYSFSVSLYDDNGDTDVSAVNGVFFNDGAVNNNCSADENNCYLDSCEITGATGADEFLGADCNVTVWFNADYSNDWDVNAWAVDPSPAQPTVFLNAGNHYSIEALHGIDIVATSIAYGTVAIGGSSGGQETSMGNVGNQAIDVMVSGAQMCDDYPTCAHADTYKIPALQQKWFHNNGTFDWDTPEGADGPYVLQTTPTIGDGGDGCANRNIAIRDKHSLYCEVGETHECTVAAQATDCLGIDDAKCKYNTTNESIWWKIRIPTSQSAGSYTGANTFATTASNTCTDDPAH